MCKDGWIIHLFSSIRRIKFITRGKGLVLLQLLVVLLLIYLLSYSVCFFFSSNNFYSEAAHFRCPLYFSLSEKSSIFSMVLYSTLLSLHCRSIVITLNNLYTFSFFGACGEVVLIALSEIKERKR